MPALIVSPPNNYRLLRFGVTYLRLNSVTLRQLYLRPKMNEYIDSLWHTLMFSTVGANLHYG